MDIEPFIYFNQFLDVNNFNKYCTAGSEIWDVEEEWNISNDDLISTDDSSGGTWEGLITYEPDERGHRPFSLGLVNDNNPWQYCRDEIPTHVPEQRQWLGAASLPISEPPAGLDLNSQGSQPSVNGRPDSKHGSRQVDTSPSKQKLPSRKEALPEPTRGSKRHKSSEKNYGACIRGRRKDEEAQTHNKFHRTLSPRRITLQEEQEEYGDGNGCHDASLGPGGSPREMLFRLQDSLLKHAREELAKSLAATI